MLLLYLYMSLPWFFAPDLNSHPLTLDEENSRHIVQVLRMKEGQRLLLTDGKGHSGEAEITNAHKKHCSVHMLNVDFQHRPSQQLTIGISLLKNSSRFEWFLEKATELGTAEIIPLICERTEKEKFRFDRYINICKSAMLQSMQTWMPILREPENFNEAVRSATQHQRFIAHCAEDDKKPLVGAFDSLLDTHIILIGPEGDFTATEIEDAKANGFIPVTLGATRLRSETAGMYAAVIGARE